MLEFTNGRIGYFHGRFQPFHYGHLAVVQEALQSCQTVALGLSNPFRLSPVVPEHFDQAATESLLKARRPENNPWPYWARNLMIREALKQEGIDLQRIIVIPNLNGTGLPVDEVRFPKSMTAIYVCPKDAHNKATALKYRADGWTVVEVVPSGGFLGSGLIRERIRRNESWEPLVPKGVAAVIKALGLDASSLNDDGLQDCQTPLSS